MYLPDCYSMRFTTYWITIWFIDDAKLVFVCLLDDLILDFCYGNLETGNRWAGTRIDHHLYLTSEPTNQVEKSSVLINFRPLVIMDGCNKCFELTTVSTLNIMDPLKCSRNITPAPRKNELLQLKWPNNRLSFNVYMPETGIIFGNYDISLIPPW